MSASETASSVMCSYCTVRNSGIAHDRSSSLSLARWKEGGDVGGGDGERREAKLALESCGRHPHPQTTRPVYVGGSTPLHLQNDALRAPSIDINVMAFPFDVMACPNTVTVLYCPCTVRRSQLMSWLPFLISLSYK